MEQEDGIVGRLVGGMIRRTVKRRFRAVYWNPPVDLRGPVVFAANHHGWHDGYLMFHAVSALGLPTVDWIAEFDAFPHFARIGGMPFPPGDMGRRTATIRKTIQLMNGDGRSLLMFGDGVLRRPKEEWAMGGALELISRRVPEASIIPTAIFYDMSTHERPEAYLSFGAPMEKGLNLASRTTEAIVGLLDSWNPDKEWDVLASGTFDVNERWDMRGKTPRGGQ